MKSNLIYISVLLLILFLGCKEKYNESPISGAYPSKYLVQVYIEAGEIVLNYDNYVDLIGVWLKGNSYNIGNEDKYQQLTNTYNDLNFNGVLIPNENKASCDDFTSVSMTCEQEVDSDHPAGSSLGDVVRLCATHAYPYISSGYTAWAAERPDFFLDLSINNNYYTPIYKFLDDVTAYDLLLLNPRFYFELPKDLAAGKYTFHVTIANDDKTLTASVDYTKP